MWYFFMTVTIYSTPTCPYCKSAKLFFDEHKIAYTDIDVSSDMKGQQQMIEISGQMGVPVIDIDGTIIVGFDKSKIERTIAAA